MKMIFKTRKSFGDTDLVHRGIQLDCQVVEYGYDTPEEIKAVGFICDSMREICKDGGMFLKFLPRRMIEAEAVNDTPPLERSHPKCLRSKRASTRQFSRQILIRRCMKNCAAKQWGSTNGKHL